MKVFPTTCVHKRHAISRRSKTIFTRAEFHVFVFRERLIVNTMTTVESVAA